MDTGAAVAGLPEAPVAVLGSGSWGTALAIQFARAGRPVRLWGRDAAQQGTLIRERRNARYLPEAGFPEALQPVLSLAEAVGGAAYVVVSVPSHAFRETLQHLAQVCEPGQRIAWATKGFEIDSGLLPHQVAQQVLGESVGIAVLSGPTFAREVGQGLPTAITVASPDAAFAGRIARDLSSPNFRAYISGDYIGVEVGGAVKNVLAIGAGLSDGLHFGANSRMALITRGLNELVRLGEALGARRETFMGLAGFGDLVLTCTDDQSRNRRFGLLLARGCSPEAAMHEIGQVVEGYQAARAVHTVAQRLGVDMPICRGIYDILYAGADAADLVRGLMGRPIKAEFD
ncbi:MAG: hypothetical protein RL026_1671 [Pseudomonadota bacterium]|jgi:glycerol-3-phosphate dehydrogenase (NAD(P)+)